MLHTVRSGISVKQLNDKLQSGHFSLISMGNIKICAEQLSDIGYESAGQAMVIVSQANTAQFMYEVFIYRYGGYHTDQLYLKE